MSRRREGWGNGRGVTRKQTNAEHVDERAEEEHAEAGGGDVCAEMMEGEDKRLAITGRDLQP